MPCKINIIRRLVHFTFPTTCAVCGLPTSITSDCRICLNCNWHLPRTHFWKNPKENPMAQLFWGQIPIENAAALFYYHKGAYSTNIIKKIKYEGRSFIAQDMGKIVATEAADGGFFEGIDVIVPIPITRRRRWKRGFNQSEEIAAGIREVTGIRVVKNAVKRISFKESQTEKSFYERKKNVENAFRLANPKYIRGKHVLIVDDVVTTGSTIISCANELLKGGARTFSVLSLGLASDV